jgi:hypothetical protein
LGGAGISREAMMELVMHTQIIPRDHVIGKCPLYIGLSQHILRPINNNVAAKP